VKRALGAAIGVAALIVALGANGSTHEFQPQWLSAVSANEFWLGGKGGVLHTSDGGRHFGRLPAPPGGAARFADSRNGFAFGWQTRLYATHDGGRTWHRGAVGRILAFVVASRTAYAVTGRCSQDGSCHDIRFERSPVSREAWRSAPMPFAHAAPNFDLAALGSSVWLFGGSSTGRYRLKNILARSSDGGRTFVTGTSPCYADLGAEPEPISSGVVWAFCPTGLQGIAWRSTDAGAHFKPLTIPHCCANSTSIGVVSNNVAVLSGNAAGTHLLRTIDGGATWRPNQAPANIVDWGSFAFFDSTGLALGSVTRTGEIELLRTTDAGASWRQVPIR
jgi:hypothetical protein